MAIVCTYRNMLKYLDNYDHAMALEKCYIDNYDHAMALEKCYLDSIQIHMSVNVDHLTGMNMLISE